LSFLNPLILFGLAAATLPILIHLLARTKSKTIRFSTLEFLKKLEHDQIRRIRLRQLLLLILRTLIVIFIVLAFARPTLKGNAAAMRSNAGSSMAIILDNSLSMQRPHNGQSLYTKAQKHAGALAELMRPGDESFLISAADTSLIISKRAFHEPSVLLREINELPMSYRRTNFNAALNMAFTLLASSQNLNKEIYLLSDMQRNGFAQDSLAVAQNQRLFLWPLEAGETANLSILKARLSSTILQRGAVAEAVVTVRNTGDAAFDNALIQFWVNERRAAQTTLQLNPGETVTKVFRFVLENSGFSFARFQLEDDDLLEDNTALVTFYVPEKIAVGLIGEDSDLFHLTLAATTEQNEANFQMQRIPLAGFNAASLNDFNLLVFSNVSQYSRNLGEKLKIFVENGGGLFFVLGDKVDIRSFNANIASALHLPQVVDVVGFPDGRGALLLEKYDISHPLFTGVFQSSSAEFTKPKFRFAVKVLMTDNIHSIMQYSNGDPFLFERPLGQGRIIVMTSGFGERLTDLSRRTIFAPLMSRILAYGGSGNVTGNTALHIGDEIRFHLQAEEVNRTLEMKRPDGDYDRLKPVMTPTGPWIYYALTNLPGIYELIVDGIIRSKWTVKIDAKEFEATPMPIKELQNSAAATVLHDNMDLDKSIAAARHGKELWRYFAIAAFLLLIAEMLIYREKGEVAAD